MLVSNLFEGREERVSGRCVDYRIYEDEAQQR